MICGMVPLRAKKFIPFLIDDLRSIGSPRWAHDEVHALFDGIAQVIVDDAPTRVEFFSRFQPGGPYDGTVGIYRRNVSAARIGIFDRELVEGLPPSVKWIAHNGAGYDSVAVHACKEKGERLSWARLLQRLHLNVRRLRHPRLQHPRCSRRSHCYYCALPHPLYPAPLLQSRTLLYAGTWKTPISSGNTHDLTTRTIGILGLGGIGLHLAQLVHAFPMRVLYHNRRHRTDVPEWCEYVESLEELCARSDVLSVHVPLHEETRGLVGEREMRAMKRGSVLVNTAREGVVDEEAMIRALEDGHLASVGLDVYPDEPRVNPRLLAFPQNALLPHTGTRTRDTERKMEVRAMTNLRDFLLTGSGKDLVPELR
ncbi:D-isomer specific 2-hydroxyacid dehydrogenase [Boletus reticuloceps]|uniref:D-isomer specific 2-hydroxyacid dehydrogenase n=1 Tax=Boletus reticuloceps TaxID=495285 RepID=A0A8I2Z1B3_9AGAM|nr:D-isomer specific 2-hydroxyacid dehydrogenase [Boletus reticuloceps]